MALNALSAPPIAPITTGSVFNSPVWTTWFNQLWRIVTSPVAIPIAQAGVTPAGITGQLYLTSTGVLAIYNGTAWKKYDGTAVVF